MHVKHATNRKKKKTNEEQDGCLENKMMKQIFAYY